MKNDAVYRNTMGFFAAASLLCYPVALLLVKGGMNVILLFMLLLALITWLKPWRGVQGMAWQPAWNGYIWAMFGLTLAILFSQFVNADWAAHPHDAPSRYWLALPVFFLLLKLPGQIVRALEFGFPLAAMLGLLLAKETGAGLTLPTLDKIHYGDYLLLFGVLSLFMLDWFGRDGWPLRLWKWLGCAAGVAAAVASGTRGALLAIPVFIAVYLVFRTSKLSARTLAQSAMLGAALLGVAYLASQTAQHRLEQLAYDISHYEQGERDTSTGIRWQLYQVAAEIFLAHPLAGVGPQGFARQMSLMEQAGKLTPMAAELGRGEVHNDVLAKAAGMGVPGLLAMLALYGVPLAMFWHKAQVAQQAARRAAILGVALVAGHIVFGLTVEFLNLTMTAAFYGFSVAVLLAACYHPELNAGKE
ncbi:MAG: hypothetical protein Fur0040_06700 [Sideroxydans sp.]